MKWIGRSALILALISLAAAAALPYLEPARQKWDRFREAWELVNRGPAAVDENHVEQPEAETVNQTIESEAPFTEIEVAETAPSSTDAKDPFLAEVRRRAQEDPAAAMIWLQTEASGKDRLRGMLEIVALWAAEDAENALLWLESNAQGLARLETLHSGIELWSQQDPAAAAEWIDGMANDGSKLTAAKTLAANWVSKNPEEASQWVGQLPPGSLRSATAKALVESWATNDPKAAAVWAFSEAQFNGDVELFNQSIQLYTEADPEEAGQLLRAVTEAHEAPGSVDTYVRTLAQEDPENALNWQAGLSADDPLNRTENLQTIMEEWSRTDSVAASIWLNDAAPGPKRDAAIAGFVETMSKFEPEAAAAWSNNISDPSQRVETLTRSVQTWSANDPEAALEWLNTTELEPGLRSALIESTQRL